MPEMPEKPNANITVSLNREQLNDPENRCTLTLPQDQDGNRLPSQGGIVEIDEDIYGGVDWRVDDSRLQGIKAVIFWDPAGAQEPISSEFRSTVENAFMGIVIDPANGLTIGSATWWGTPTNPGLPKAVKVSQSGFNYLWFVQPDVSSQVSLTFNPLPEGQSEDIGYGLVLQSNVATDISGLSYFAYDPKLRLKRKKGS